MSALDTHFHPKAVAGYERMLEGSELAQEAAGDLYMQLCQLQQDASRLTGDRFVHHDEDRRLYVLFATHGVVYVAQELDPDRLMVYAFESLGTEHEQLIVRDAAIERFRSPSE